MTKLDMINDSIKALEATRKHISFEATAAGGDGRLTSYDIRALEQIALDIAKLCSQAERTAPENGQDAYKIDCQRQPHYHDGTIRKPWDQLSEAVQWSWDRKDEL